MDIKQHLLKRKRSFDEDVQQYKGPDPLKLRCDFFNWLENYSKEDTADIYFTLLEETLKAFIEDPVYKQDLRYINLWLNYSKTQPNPADVLKNIHSKGLGTECAILYSSWAEHLVKAGLIANAFKVLKMGLKSNIVSKDDLQKQYDNFLKDIGLKLLLGEICCPKCGNTFKVTDECNNEVEKVIYWEWNPLKVGEKDDFKCPVAYFEEQEANKIRMYPKHKVYPGNNQEFSLEEIMAMEYEKRYEEERLKAETLAREEERRRAEEAEAMAREEERRRVKEELRRKEGEKSNVKHINPPVQASIPLLPKLQLPKRQRIINSPGEISCKRKPTIVPGGLPTEWPKEVDNSAVNSTTFTAHMKEAMNVVQDMWSSPAPSDPPRAPYTSEKKPDCQSINTPRPFEIYTEEEPPSHKPIKTPFQIFDENSMPRKPPSSTIKSQPFDVYDENAPPETILTKQPSTVKPKTPFSIFEDNEEKTPSMVKPEITQTKRRVQLFKGEAADLVEKFENQARIQPPPMFNVRPERNEDLSDVTCNTKAFEFVLPSSTPLANQKKSHSQMRSEEIQHKLPEHTNLSVIFEQSKDKSGNSSTNSVVSQPKSLQRADPVLQTDTNQLLEGELFEELAIYLDQMPRKSSLFQFSLLETISEEDSFIIGEQNSCHSLNDLNKTYNVSGEIKSKQFNVEVDLNLTGDSEEDKVPEKEKSPKRPLSILNTDFTLHSLDKENLAPGMLGFPSFDKSQLPNFATPPKKSSHLRPETSIQDKENLPPNDFTPSERSSDTKLLIKKTKIVTFTESAELSRSNKVKKSGLSFADKSPLPQCQLKASESSRKSISSSSILDKNSPYKVVTSKTANQMLSETLISKCRNSDTKVKNTLTVKGYERTKIVKEKEVEVVDAKKTKPTVSDSVETFKKRSGSSVLKDVADFINAEMEKNREKKSLGRKLSDKITSRQSISLSFSEQNVSKVTVRNESHSQSFGKELLIPSSSDCNSKQHECSVKVRDKTLEGKASQAQHSNLPKKSSSRSKPKIAEKEATTRVNNNKKYLEKVDGNALIIDLNKDQENNVSSKENLKVKSDRFTEKDHFAPVLRSSRRISEKISSKLSPELPNQNGHINSRDSKIKTSFSHVKPPLRECTLRQNSKNSFADFEEPKLSTISLSKNPRSGLAEKKFSSRKPRSKMKESVNDLMLNKEEVYTSCSEMSQSSNSEVNSIKHARPRKYTSHELLSNDKENKPKSKSKSKNAMAASDKENVLPNELEKPKLKGERETTIKTSKTAVDNNIPLVSYASSSEKSFSSYEPSTASEQSDPNWSTERIRRKKYASQKLGKRNIKSKKTTYKKNPTCGMDSGNKTKRRVKNEKNLDAVRETSDPFDPELLEELLDKSGFPKPHHLERPIFVKETNLPTGNKTMKLGEESFNLQGEIGKGAYARVIKATNSRGMTVALKIEKPACRWEYYIAREIQARVPPQYAAAFMDINAAYIYNNGSILETHYAKYGTLFSNINASKERTGRNLDCGVVLHFAIELIDIVDFLHKSKIIHADMKPDNVVLRELPSHDETEPCLQLIDFGRCIDMSLFPPDTKFKHIFKTEDNKCIEMKENRSWTYQIDLQGLASIFHCLLITEYMKVVKKHDCWQLQKPLPRNLKSLWNPIFDSLLNVNPDKDLPFNFAPMRAQLVSTFESSRTLYLQNIKSFRNIIVSK